MQTSWRWPTEKFEPFSCTCSTIRVSRSALNDYIQLWSVVLTAKYEMIEVGTQSSYIIRVSSSVLVLHASGFEPRSSFLPLTPPGYHSRWNTTG